MSLRELAEAGDSLALLKALQRRIATQLDRTDSARDVAALSKQLRDVTREIEEYEPSTEMAPKTTALELVRGKHKKGA